MELKRNEILESRIFVVHRAQRTASPDYIKNNSYNVRGKQFEPPSDQQIVISKLGWCKAVFAGLDSLASSPRIDPATKVSPSSANPKIAKGMGNIKMSSSNPKISNGNKMRETVFVAFGTDKIRHRFTTLGDFLFYGEHMCES